MSVQIEFNKDIAYREKLLTLDNIITTIANTYNIDFSDKVKYPALMISGSLSNDTGTDINTVIADKLKVGQEINLSGDVDGYISKDGEDNPTTTFDGSKDVVITTSVNTVNGAKVEDILNYNDPIVKNAYNIPYIIDDKKKSITYIGDVGLDDIFKTDIDEYGKQVITSVVKSADTANKIKNNVDFKILGDNISGDSGSIIIGAETNINIECDIFTNVYDDFSLEYSESDDQYYIDISSIGNITDINNIVLILKNTTESYNTEKDLYLLNCLNIKYNSIQNNKIIFDYYNKVYQKSIPNIRYKLIILGTEKEGI